MKVLKSSCATLACATALALATTASAQVSLQLSDKDATPGSTSIVKGPSGFPFIPISVLLNSASSAPANQVTSVDYTLRASVNSIFTVSSRNTQTSGSVFSAPYLTDAGAAGTVLATNNSTPNLGGTVPFGNPAVSNNTFEVADYQIQVNSNAAAGTYTITTQSNPPGVGYSGPSVTDQPFSSQGSFQVTLVVPEPGSVTLLGTSVALLCLGRRPGSRQRA